MCEMDCFDTSKVHFDGMIANNGQLIYDEQGKVIYSSPFSGRLKEIIVDNFNKKRIPMLLASDDYIFANFLNYKMIKIQQSFDSPMPIIKDYEGENIYLCSALKDETTNWDEIPELSEIANITYWHDCAIDISSITTSKATGIQKVLDYYNISLEDTMAIGDGNNDIEMLEYCHTSIAMGNSEQDVKEAANYITTDINNDGIYNAFKHYGLI